MRRSLIPLLACPACSHPLSTDGDNDPILEGSLRCAGCDLEFDVSHGLPLLLLRDAHWGQTQIEVEGEQEFVNELPLSEHIKRNRFETGRTLRLLEKVQIPDNPLILDLGGSSGLGAALFERFGARVVITDIVPFLLKVGEAFLAGRVDADFVVSKMEHLPFLADQFDVVFCRQALHHSPEPGRAVAEMFRVAKPGGQVLIASEPCVSLADILSDRYARWRGIRTPWMDDPILSKLPDDDFLATWPRFSGWIGRVTEDYRIEPAGGSAATIPTPEGLRFVTHNRERKFWGKMQEAILPGHRGFRGDINILARKTRPVERDSERLSMPPVRATDFSMGEFSDEEKRNLRDVMSPMIEPLPPAEW